MVYNKIMGHNYLKLERIIKGFANHRRLEILNLLKTKPGLSVDNIAEILRIGYQNASDHIRKLYIAGLVSKKSLGTSVVHQLTHRAEAILVFCKKLE